MSIQIKTGAQQPAYAFNETRLNKILNASTLNEAQRMGFWDKLTDTLFRGSAKQQAIRELYESITRPSPHESKPADMLTRFHRLRDLAVAENQNQFTAAFSRPDAQGAWGYSLSIDNTCTYSSPAGMQDDQQNSFAGFHGLARADHMLQQTRSLAKVVREQADTLAGQGGYIDVPAFKALRDEFDEALNAFDRSAQTSDAIGEMLDLQQTHPLTADKVFHELRRTNIGSTNLLQALYGDRAPTPKVEAVLANIVDDIAAGQEDLPTLIAESKRLGDAMILQMPGASPEAGYARIDADFKALATKMSNEQLAQLYKSFMANPELILASQGILEVNILASNEAPSDAEGERAFMKEVFIRSQPFKWGLEAVGTTVFSSIKEVMANRGMGDQVLSEERETAITNKVQLSPPTVQLLSECVIHAKPIDEVVEGLRSSGGLEAPDASFIKA